MKKILVYLLVSLLCTSVLQAQKFIRVRLYGGTNAYNGPDQATLWNNWDVNTPTSPAFVYTDASTSTVTGVLTGAIAIGDNGATYGSSSNAGDRMAPLEVLRYVSGLSVNRTLTLNGLSANKTYDLELYASRYNNSGNSTQFVINGGSETVATYQNFTNKASFTSLVANASGQIVVSIEKLNTYLYINGFTLTEINPPPPPTGDGWSLSGNDATAAQFIGTKNNVPLLFKTNNVSQMRITTSGEVQVKKLKVIQTGWADYVFEPGYKLIPLSEVERYIKKHKHLPEVPSAKEVIAQGLNVGDNHVVLLKKIEELTLYMIEQNKRLEAQAAQIKALQQQAKIKKK